MNVHRDLKMSLVKHSVFNLGRDSRGVANHISRGREYNFMYTAVSHLLYSSFRWGGRWVIVGCCNRSRYKKGRKPLV